MNKGITPDSVLTTQEKAMLVAFQSSLSRYRQEKKLQWRAPHSDPIYNAAVDQLWIHRLIDRTEAALLDIEKERNRA